MASVCNCVITAFGTVPSLLSTAINVTGLLGCNLATFSNAWNACHCFVEGGAGIRDLIMPIYGQMGETFGGGKGG